MVIHKAPVAVALASYLAACRWPAAALNWAMAVFAAASPISALVTYAALSMVASKADEEGGGFAVALALLVSGGTVLYAAAVHVLPEALEAPNLAAHAVSGGHDSRGSCGGDVDDVEQQGLISGAVGGSSGVASCSAAEAQRQRRKVLLWLTSGMAIPLLLSATMHHEHGHHHGHD